MFESAQKVMAASREVHTDEMLQGLGAINVKFYSPTILFG